MCFSHNIVTEKVAHIFINEECNRFALMTEEEKRAEFAQDFYDSMGQTCTVEQALEDGEDGFNSGHAE